ncbi:MAG TPA: hypothetical protein VLB87_09775 [Pyrinomonadaceae bacterium]|nr:hypothetical protein [Pyrinomonadaceae bacterium]
MRLPPPKHLLCSAVVLVVCAVAVVAQDAAAKKAAPAKLPSAEKIVDNYLKAIGGKKTAAARRDASYEWIVQLNNQPIGTARTLRKAPASERFELTFGNGQIISASNNRSAWEIGLDKQLRTLTNLEAATAKLQTILAASRLIDYKKANVLARVVSLGDLGSEPAYILEFSTRSGARLQYYFSVKSKLITKITGDVKVTGGSPNNPDELKKIRLIFEDYRAEQGLLEPHRVRMTLPGDGSGELTLVLQSVKYDTGIKDQLFDPPAATEKLDVTALLREVAANQHELEFRVAEYSFKQTETDREINSKGELKKQTVKVYEVFPLPNREPVEKLISENGVPLSPERAAKEDKRVQEEFLKAERENEKKARETAKRSAETKREQNNGGSEKQDKSGSEKSGSEKNRGGTEVKSDEESDNPAISLFLRVCDFVSPRRERFEGRESIVFDFRPRAGFKPKSREESLIAKLVGVIWIDPVDKQVMRLEARLAEGFKIAGGLVASLKPGAALVMEQTRMEQGVWLPRFAHINLSVKVLLFGGGDFNKTIEWSDYKHFSGDVKGYKIEAPASARP